MRILLIYHFFYPDPVVSARIFSDLAEGLTRAGHQVTVYTCNRTIREGRALKPLEDWHGIRIHRFVRPDVRQGSNLGRLFNSIFLQLKWIRYFWLKGKEIDAVVIGTDPQFSYLMFPWIRLLSRRVKLIHWCFDLYPEALAATGKWWMKIPAFLIRPFAHFSYRFVDVMADLGPCMRRRLQKYNSPCRYETLTPWALVEPEEIPQADPALRRQLFRDAKIALLYSGTIGAAHDIAPFIALARECRKRGVDAAFCFAGCGNSYEEQIAGITPEDTNISIAGFASEAELKKRLAAADVHMISLRPGWEGVVLPSKSFGALAIGRPLLCCGATSGDLNYWVSKYRIGWNFEAGDMENVLSTLKSLCENPEELVRLRQSAFACYHAHFSRKIAGQRWKELFTEEAKLRERK